MKKIILILLFLTIIILVGCKKEGEEVSGSFIDIPQFPDLSKALNSLSSGSSVKTVQYTGGTCTEYYDWGDNKKVGGYFISVKNGQTQELTDFCSGNQLTEFYCDSSSNNDWGYKTKNYACGQNKCKTKTESGTGRIMAYCS